MSCLFSILEYILYFIIIFCFLGWRAIQPVLFFEEQRDRFVNLFFYMFLCTNFRSLQIVVPGLCKQNLLRNSQCENHFVSGVLSKLHIYKFQCNKPSCLIYLQANFSKSHLPLLVLGSDLFFHFQFTQKYERNWTVYAKLFGNMVDPMVQFV